MDQTREASTNGRRSAHREHVLRVFSARRSARMWNPCEARMEMVYSSSFSFPNTWKKGRETLNGVCGEHPRVPGSACWRKACSPACAAKRVLEGHSKRSRIGQEAEVAAREIDNIAA